MTLSPQDIRNATLMKLVDVTKGPGLEIGPLHSPIVTEDMADVRYVDVFSRDELRANYANDPNVNLGDIPEIHFVLSGPEGLRRLPEVVGPAAPFAWVIASHVIEHVPDLIAWLAEIAEILDDGGQLLLVVPDRRFTFDILRPWTTVGQMLQAHDLAETKPSVRAVFDMIRNAVTVNLIDAWRGELPGPSDRIHDLAMAVSEAQRVRDGDYVDSHVWMFTPGLLVEQVTELGRLGLSDFVVEKIVPTALDQNEFYAVLRRLPRGLTGDELAHARAQGITGITDADPVRLLLDAEIERLESEILDARQRAKELEEELAQVRTSERWRLGGFLATPAAAVKRLLIR